MICLQIQLAKSEKSNLHVVVLDLENAFGLIPHKTVFNFFQMPEPITNHVKTYFQDLQHCFSTSGFTTMWQSLEIGIMADCTISPLAFTMGMGKWVVDGKQLTSVVNNTNQSIHGQHNNAYYNNAMHHASAKEAPGEDLMGQDEDQTIQIKEKLHHHCKLNNQYQPYLTNTS